MRYHASVNQVPVADSVPFGARRDGLVLLNFVLGSREIRFLSRECSLSLVDRGFRQSQLAKGTGVCDRNINIGGTGACLPGGQVRARMIERGLVVIWIKLDEQGASLDVLIVFNSGVDIEHRATDPARNHVNVTINLGIIRGFEMSSMEPPGGRRHRYKCKGSD